MSYKDVYTALEISPYELTSLKKYLIAAPEGWIPDSTSEEAIEDAVYNFHASFKSRNGKDPRFPVYSRIQTLWDAWDSDETVEYVQTPSMTGPTGVSGNGDSKASDFSVRLTSTTPCVL